MDSSLEALRKRLPLIAPYAAGCIGFETKPTMNGTAFFPGGDGVWKARQGDEPAFPMGGVLVLGSDFGDVVSYDARFEREIAYRHELNGATWRNLLKLIDTAGIPREALFCTNAWPCLREGDEPVKGGIPGSLDREFTMRCRAFFTYTLALMRPSLVIMLGLAPTAFVAMLAPDGFAPWVEARSWKDVDRLSSVCHQNVTFVPIVHPSMPNRRHRITNTFEAEAALLKTAYSERPQL